MSLPTPSQSVSHKQFHQCVNHKKKLSLRHLLPTFGSFFRHPFDSGFQKLTESYKNKPRHLFQCYILIPRKCPRKTPFQHTVPPLPLSPASDIPARPIMYSITICRSAEAIYHSLKHEIIVNGGQITRLNEFAH